MSTHNPPHPGEFIESINMGPYELGCRYLAEHPGIAASTLNRVIKGKSQFLLKWLCSYLKFLAVHQRVGLLCKTIMKYGKLERELIFQTFNL